MTRSDVGLRFASRMESRISAAFGGSMSPSTWMTAMPAFESSRAARGAASAVAGSRIPSASTASTAEEQPASARARDRRAQPGHS